MATGLTGPPRVWGLACRDASAGSRSARMTAAGRCQPLSFMCVMRRMPSGRCMVTVPEGWGCGVSREDMSVVTRWRMSALSRRLMYQSRICMDRMVSMSMAFMMSAVQSVRCGVKPWRSFHMASICWCDSVMGAFVCGG